MPVLPILAGVGAVATVVGTVQSARYAKKSVKAQQAANKFERQKQQLTTMRQRQEAVRTARQSYAQVQQAAENQGVAQSSVAAGGEGSIFSQMTGNLSFLDQYGFLSDQAGKSLEKSMGYQAKSSLWNTVAEVGSKVFSMAGGLQGH